MTQGNIFSFPEPNGADFSKCGKHRYKLWRIWDEGKPMAMCIGLNPSKATVVKNDATIGILTRMLTKLGYGGFYMMNLFTIISSDPDILKDQDNLDEGGSGVNYQNMREVASKCKDVIFAWGGFKEAKERGKKMKELFPDALCFGKNSVGAPVHPMAMMYSGKQDNPTLSLFINEIVDDVDYKKFVQGYVPFSDLKKVGFFPKEMKFNNYEEITKIFLSRVGAATTREYINSLPELYPDNQFLSGKFPDKIDENGEIKMGGGFHLSFTQRDIEIVCPICECRQIKSVSTDLRASVKKCKGCKRKIKIVSTKEGYVVSEL